MILFAWKHYNRNIIVCLQLLLEWNTTKIQTKERTKSDGKQRETGKWKIPPIHIKLVQVYKLHIIEHITYWEIPLVPESPSFLSCKK
jgi:hypothetical protein